MFVRHLRFLVTSRRGLMHLLNIGLSACGHALVIGWLGTKVSGSGFGFESLLVASLALWLLSAVFAWHRGGRYEAIISAGVGGYIFLLHVVIYSQLML